MWEPGGEFIRKCFEALALINEFREVDDKIHTPLFHQTRLRKCHMHRKSECSDTCRDLTLRFCRKVECRYLMCRARLRLEEQDGDDLHLRSYDHKRNAKLWKRWVMTFATTLHTRPMHSYWSKNDLRSFCTCFLMLFIFLTGIPGTSSIVCSYKNPRTR